MLINNSLIKSSYFLRAIILFCISRRRKSTWYLKSLPVCLTNVLKLLFISSIGVSFRVFFSPEILFCNHYWPWNLLLAQKVGPLANSHKCGHLCLKSLTELAFRTTYGYFRLNTFFIRKKYWSYIMGRMWFHWNSLTYKIKIFFQKWAEGVT